MISPVRPSRLNYGLSSATEGVRTDHSSPILHLSCQSVRELASLLSVDERHLTFLTTFLSPWTIRFLWYKLTFTEPLSVNNVHTNKHINFWLVANNEISCKQFFTNYLFMMPKWCDVRTQVFQNSFAERKFDKFKRNWKLLIVSYVKVTE